VRLTNLYDKETGTQTLNRGEGQTDIVGHTHGKRDPMYLRVGHGGQLYVGAVGQGSGQRGNFQDDFTRVFYSYRRHDWVPVWYQVDAERRQKTPL